jgi:cytochrome c2
MKYRWRLLLSCVALSACTEDAAKHADVGDTERGRLMLRRYECGACHLIPNVSGARGRVGPSLEDFARRPYVAGKFPNTPPILIAWIMNPPSMAPATAMPAIGIPIDDAQDMAAYLYTLD